MTGPEAMRQLENIGLAAMAEIVAGAGEGTAEELAATLRVAPRHRGLFGRWLVALTGAGLLTANGDRLRCAPSARTNGLDAAYAELGFPQRMAAFHCAALASLPQLLRGEIAVQDLLFADGDHLAALAAYQDNHATKALNAACADLVRAAAGPEPLRVLEVGGGAAGTTEAVLAALAGLEVDYLFTDRSTLFTVAAAGRLNVRTARLDLNRDLADQGFAPGSTDVVVAGNVLHNAVDLGFSLRELREVLVPGGTLVFTDCVRDNHAVLTSMHFLLSAQDGDPAPGSGDRRGAELFPPAEHWQEELIAAGFIPATVTQPDIPGGQRLFHAVAAPRTNEIDDLLRDALGPNPARTAVLLSDGVAAQAVRAAGGTVLSGSEDTRPAAVLAFLERSGASTAVLPAALADALAADPAAALTDLAELTRVVCVGEPHDPGALAELGPEVHVVRPSTPAVEPVAAAEAEAELALAGLDVTAAAEVSDAVSALCLRAMLAALHHTGSFTAGSAHTEAEILTTARVLPEFHPLVRRWLTVLTGEGLLALANGRYSSTVDAGADLAADWDRQAERWAATLGSAHTVAYVRQSAGLLPELLRGTEQAVHLLFPEGRTEVAAALYRESATARYQRAAVAGALRAVAESTPGRLRVLEVGAGTGGTTDAVLPALRGQDVDYLFTDVSRYFLEQARGQFGDRIRYGQYDIDAAPATQGMAPGQFDVVLAGGVLNAAADTDTSVRWLTELLVPGGWLVLTEPTAEEHWVMASQGFLMAQAQDARAESGATFLSLDQWLAVLTGAGLHVEPVLPPAEHPLTRLGHRVFLTRTPERT
ncbi:MULTISPECIES: class I SAM-dependent methyltransferase [unclassified Crossiella]|uniref:methyltransferase n=1 Tax=unclassified Crossiella TaxID=2620835 RepID=UPI001FFF78A6|nr:MULTISPECIES: class I SAM-dependent methyltransferase [unclassified Crossiella]MCK2244648.1 class I SAM-dependent methyltransferase [Crossiella sp. S99.2]MCK2258365.1 class I SAM-dependent methyltransferase [Crossiella sp. S99.1]